MKTIKIKRILLFSALLGIIAWQAVNNLFIRPLTTIDDKPLPYLDTIFWYCPEKAYEVINTYTPSAVEGYFYFQITDLVLPILYSTLLFVGISLSYKNKWGIVVIAGAIFDYLENLSIHILFRILPETSFGLAMAANIFGTLKFILLLIAASLAIVSALKFLRLQNKDSIKQFKNGNKQ